MYKFIQTTNKNMNHHLNQIGDLTIYGVGAPIMFMPIDDIHHTMVTSTVVSFIKTDDQVIVNTENSTYIFMEVK